MHTQVQSIRRQMRATILLKTQALTCEIQGRRVMTRELVTTDDEISPRRRNAATRRDAVRRCSEDVMDVEIVAEGIDGASGIRTRTLADACCSPRWQEGLELVAI